MPRLTVLALASLCLFLVGCGNPRATAPSLTKPAITQSFRTLSYPGIGVSIAVPKDWLIAHTHFPLVMVAASGNAIVALWRYRRRSPVPAGQAELTRDRISLIAAARARQPGLQLLSSRQLRLDHRPAVVLEALERIRGLLRRVRSIHLYAPREEVVLEEYAPVNVFELVSRRVFVPVRRSLVVGTR